MKNFVIAILLFPLMSVKPQSTQIENFFNDLINNNQNDLSNYIQPGSLQKSKRLGINYEGIKNKFLISYDIDESIKEKINKGEISYQITEKELNDNYKKITFKTDGIDFTKEFFFQNNLLVDPSSFYTNSWKTKESKFFRIFISEPSQFNDYSMQQLDAFVETMLDLLKVEQPERELLEKEKIDYILCRNEKEIEEISGFNTRGIYILAYDQIITTYNCHFHEIAHLLINFKLKNLPLYTLPFFQEGFATQQEEEVD